MQQKQPYWGKVIGLAILLSLFVSQGYSQSSNTTDSLHRMKKRKQLVWISSSTGYVGGMYGLYNLWYKDYPLTKFHWHNDNQDWFQMDKVGHAYSCYYEGVVGIDMMKWAGFSHTKASILGGSYGFLLQAGVEVFDGFSEAWGASSGDLIANALGSSLAISQSLLWDEQRIGLKLSYQPTNFAPIRPELLGSSFVERLFKDYNGQSYWLSGNVSSFLPEESKFPKWLNVAVGYGINGFVASNDNTFERDGQQFDYTYITQSRQLYLAPDIDLTRIRTESKALKISLRLLNCIKFPLPGLAYDNKSQKFAFNFLQF